jgi:hypothetical protein
MISSRKIRVALVFHQTFNILVEMMLFTIVSNRISVIPTPPMWPFSSDTAGSLSTTDKKITWSIQLECSIISIVFDGKELTAGSVLAKRFGASTIRSVDGRRSQETCGLCWSTKLATWFPLITPNQPSICSAISSEMIETGTNDPYAQLIQYFMRIAKHLLII